jgi:hypothetical protein
MFLIDRIYFMKILSKIEIYHINTSVTIRDIDTVTHCCFEYVSIEILILETTKIVSHDSREIAKLSRQAHVIDNLRAKFLMSMNILRSKEVILNISRRKMILSFCENLKVNMRITSKMKSRRVNQVILVERMITISAKSMTSVFIRRKNKNTLFERDYLF